MLNSLARPRSAREPGEGLGVLPYGRFPETNVSPMTVPLFKSHQDEFWRVESLEGTDVVLVERSAAPFPSPHSIELSCMALHRGMEALDRPRHVLLIDLRKVMGRNDPDFERVMEPERVRLQQGFRRVAVIVNSVVGQLQVQRHAAQDGAKLRTFFDYAKALAWLTG